jgi:hypothetical protein
MARKFTYSFDREDFVGSYNSAEEARQAAVCCAEGLSNPPTEIYIGQLGESDPQVTDHAGAVIAAMNARARGKFGEQARNYLHPVSAEQIRELDNALAETISAWLRRQNLMPTFRMVCGVREYQLLSPATATT